MMLSYSMSYNSIVAVVVGIVVAFWLLKRSQSFTGLLTGILLLCLSVLLVMPLLWDRYYHNAERAKQVQRVQQLQSAQQTAQRRLVSIENAHALMVSFDSRAMRTDVTAEQLAEAIETAGEMLRELPAKSPKRVTSPHKHPELKAFQEIPVGDGHTLGELATLSLQETSWLNENAIWLGVDRGDQLELLRSLDGILSEALHPLGYTQWESGMLMVKFRGMRIRQGDMALAEIPLEADQSQDIQNVTGDSSAQEDEPAADEPTAEQNQEAETEAPEDANAEDETADLAPLALLQPPAEVVQKRPSWTSRVPRVDDDGVYRTTLFVGPYTTMEECEKQLNEQLLSVAQGYVADLLGPAAQWYVPLTKHEVRHQIQQATWHESFRHPEFGEMHSLHVLVAFDSAFRNQVMTTYRENLVHHRIRLIAGAAALLLALLGSVFAYLKLDTLTRGYYRTRLRLAVAGTWLFLGAATFGWIRLSGGLW